MINRDILRQNFSDVRQRMASAGQKTKNSESDLRLIAVSKTVPSAAMVAAWQMGQRDFGENYVQEAVEKIHNWPVFIPNGENPPLSAPIWHMIGPIQSNKSKWVAQHFDWAHSIDRLKIAQRLSEQRPAHLPDLQVCVQVNICNEASKSGTEAHDVLQLCQAVAQLPRLRLRGLMALPDPSLSSGQTEAAFLALRQLYEQCCQGGLALDTLSMGMSDDFELAIACGSNCVRVGRALFGERVKKQESIVLDSSTTTKP